MYLSKAIIVISFIASAAAEQASTHFVLAKAARIPGVRLKPGSYEVRVVESLPDRFILQVSDDKKSRPLATFLAIPDANLPHATPGQPVFWNNHGHEAAVRGLWLASYQTGAQFVFEKEEAAKLAKQYKEPVPAVDPSSEGMKPLAKMNDSDRQIVTLWLLSAVAVTPDGEQTGIQAAKFVPAQQQAAPQRAQTEPPSESSNLQVARNTRPALASPAPRPAPRVASNLPNTAGNFSTYLLLGIGFIVGGGFLRRKVA